VTDVPGEKPQANQQAKRVTDKRRRWRASASECEYDPELELELGSASVKTSELRRNAANAQESEARRLAKEYALLRPATRREEITGARITRVKAVIGEWEKTLTTLRKIKREF
jgi:hypothetical protein